MTNLLITELENKTCPVLVIEDSDEDFEAFSRGWRKSGATNSLYRCESGDEALDFLYHRGEYTDTISSPRPCLILLDLNLPGTDGREILEEIKTDENMRSIPVVIFTTSSNPKDLEICYQKGANSYIIKPIDVKKLMETVKTLGQYWFDINRPPLHVF
ncbi:response regulator [Mastigocoleus sp. MO_188.B34]|uniref:response regulator n=1 Tax=Mastigocoleus sp. MO_188.B34 TaxID=3036635 RepID=UPI0026114966|nr:response regulator [Mastigocoleus sp. MO_188.B34]MDJ0694622.1 response regulator [Mastigocoleus sp. MO_188.B34]